MKYFDWNEDKNDWLMANRGISFELCIECIVGGQLLDIVENHIPYEHQKVFIIEIDDYAYEVPFVEDDVKIFLKTAYASHEATKKYLSNK
jgi:hypothetical protein